MLDENDIVTAILRNAEAQDALRVITVITRIAIREVALRSNSAPPVEDTTVIGRMTIDRLRRTVTVRGEMRPIKPREFALLETLARRPGIVFLRERCITLAWPDDTDAMDRTVVIPPSSAFVAIRARCGPPYRYTWRKFRVNVTRQRIRREGATWTSIEPIAQGVVDEFGSVQPIAKVVLAATDTRPASNVASGNFTLTDAWAASSQLVEQSAQAPRESPACGRRHEDIPALRLRRMPASVASGSRPARR